MQQWLRESCSMKLAGKGISCKTLKRYAIILKDRFIISNSMIGLKGVVSFKGGLAKDCEPAKKLPTFALLSFSKG